MTQVSHLIVTCLLVVFVAPTPTFASGYVDCPAVSACDNCQANSTCILNECVCESSGIPNFNCFNPSHNYVCYVQADPTFKSLNKHAADIHFFGNTKLVSLYTDHPDGGYCGIEIYGYTTKVKGKFYLFALRFKSSFLIDGTTDSLEGSVLSFETGCETTYEYRASIAGTPVGTVNASEPAGTVLWDGTPNRQCGLIYTLAEGGFFKVESPKGGYKFALRPRHHEYTDLPHGFWFHVCKEYNPVVFDQPAFSCPLCLCPDAQGDNYTSLQLETGLSDKTYALIYYAYVNTGSQNVSFPGYTAPTHLDTIKDILQSCTLARRQLLFDEGGFAFTCAHFIRCIGVDDEGYSKAILDLVQYYCLGDVSKCESFITEANGKCASQASKIHGLPAFIEKNCTEIVV